jgi:hypothetical protein
MLIRIHAEDLPSGERVKYRTACGEKLELIRDGNRLTVFFLRGKKYPAQFELPDTDYDGHPLGQCYILINLATGLPPQLQFVDTNLPF